MVSGQPLIEGEVHPQDNEGEGVTSEIQAVVRLGLLDVVKEYDDEAIWVGKGQDPEWD